MTDKPTIVEALSAVMEDVRSVHKGDRNEAQQFNFRGIDAVVNAVGPALRAHGVVVLPEVLESTNSEIVVGQRNTRMRHVQVRVRYHFHGPAGDTLTAVTEGESMDSGDKAVAKAMSVAWRIALLQAFTIPTDEPDPDSQSVELGEAHAEPSVPKLGDDERTKLAEALRAAPDAQREAAKAWLVEHEVPALTKANGITVDQANELEAFLDRWEAEHLEPSANGASA